MAQAAHVDSIDRLKEFRVALCLFIDTVNTGLNEAEGQVQQTGIWLKHDQPSYWKTQINRRREQFSQAKNALNAKKLTRTPLGGRYSCIDEEKAFQLAKHRLEEAEQKLKNVQRWERVFEDEVLEYKGQVHPLARTIDSELPNAIAQLDRMITALESYAALSAPEAEEVMAEVLLADESEAPRLEGSFARPEAELPSATDFGKLRKLTPPAEVRGQVTMGESAIDWPGCEPLNQPQRDAVGGLPLPRAAIVPEQTVVMARGLGSKTRLYLERTGPAVAGDSGWYVGAADSPATNGLQAVSVKDLLAARPDWAELLQMPSGTLAVLAGGSIAAILDSGNRVIWPSAVGGTSA
jgi:hypothetical protein